MSDLFRRIDTVFLPVKSFEESIEWYVNTLGFTVRWRLESGYAALNIGETPLTLVRTPADEFQPLSRVAFNFYTPDIEHAHTHLEKLGVELEPIQDYVDVKTFDFKDLDGNVLSVCYFAE